MDKTAKIDGPEDPSKAGQAVGLNLVDLSKELNRAEHNFHKSRDTQGVLGSSYDWMKNNLGGSYETGSWFARRWSNVLNYDMGSEAIQKNIDRTKQLVAAGQTDKIVKATEIADGRISLKTTNTAREYNNDQRLGVNFLADTATFAAVALARGKGVIDLAVRGAVVKSGLKAVDGSYSKPLDDAATGAFIGVMTPFAGALGKTTGMIAETAPAALQSRAVSAVRFGTEGAVLGHTQQISSLFEQKRVDGERAGQAFWKANLDSVANPTGAALGFVGGGLGGFLFGRARISQSVVPEVPSPPNLPTGPRSPLAPASNSAEGLQIPRALNSPSGPIEPISGPHPKGSGKFAGSVVRAGADLSSPPSSARSPLSELGAVPAESAAMTGARAAGVNGNAAIGKAAGEIRISIPGSNLPSIPRIIDELRGPRSWAIEERVPIKPLSKSVYPEYSVPDFRRFESALRSEKATVMDFEPFGAIRSVADGDKKLQSMNLKWQTKGSLREGNLSTNKVVFSDGTELVGEKLFLPHMSKSSTVREILPTERPDLKFIKMVEIDDSFRLTKIDENTTLFHNLSTNVANVYRRDHSRSLAWDVKEGTNPKSVLETIFNGNRAGFKKTMGDFDPALLQKTAEGRPLRPYLEQESMVKDVPAPSSPPHGKLKMLPYDEFQFKRNFYEENAKHYPAPRWSPDCNELSVKNASGQITNFFIPTANFIETADTTTLYSILGNNRRALRELTQTPALTKGSVEKGIVSEAIFDEKAIRLSFSGQFETSLAKDKGMYFARTGDMFASLEDLEKAVKTAITYAKSKDGTILVVDSTKHAQENAQLKLMLPGYTSGAQKRLGGITEEVYEDLQSYVAGKHLVIVKPESLKANITGSGDREFRQLFIDEFATQEVLARAFAAGKKLELTETSSLFKKQVEANLILAEKTAKEVAQRKSEQRRSVAPELKSLPIPGSGRN
ncbi:MAG: hypothetical protein WC815_21265 [Vicinamibacterales bacterium]|jgi:hypothetical protein